MAEFEEVDYDPWGDPSVEELKALYRNLDNNHRKMMEQHAAERKAFIEAMDQMQVSFWKSMHEQHKLLSAELEKMRKAIALGMEEAVAAISQPRIVRLKRDANGRPESATSELAITRH